MILFALETSCDETATAILEFDKNGHFKILNSQVSSQVELHSSWGGVVPNLAAREHSKNLVPLIEKTLEEAKIKPKEIDLFCVTAGPGLIPALLIGVNSAKTLSYFYQKPLIGVHHIEGHIYSNFIKKNQGDLNQFDFPVLNLVISGGHTQLILMKNHLQYEIIGETQDDAVGEAFDKVAKMMGLGYPGGPVISQMANEAEERIKKMGISDLSKVRGKTEQREEFTNSVNGTSRGGFDKEICQICNSHLEIEFPRPMLNSKDLNFSFSGLKTSVLYFYQKLEEEKLPEKEMKNWKLFIAKAFQDAVVDVLEKKTFDAIEIHQPKTVLLSGGVSANSKILGNIKNKLAEDFPETVFNAPEISLCGDNASMIAVA